MRSFLFRRAPPGALILPRHVADRAQVLWPKCLRCMRTVDAYGIEAGDIEDDSDRRPIEVWARCDGIRRDPQSGRALHGAPKVHESMKTSATITKGPGWSRNRFAEIVSKMAFFAPPGEGDRDFVQNLTPQNVSKRWDAG